MLLGAAQFECQPATPRQLVRAYRTVLDDVAEPTRRSTASPSVTSGCGHRRAYRGRYTSVGVFDGVPVSKKMLPTAVSSRTRRRAPSPTTSGVSLQDIGDLRGDLLTIGAMDGGVKCHAAGDPWALALTACSGPGATSTTTRPPVPRRRPSSHDVAATAATLTVFTGRRASRASGRRRPTPSTRSTPTSPSRFRPRPTTTTTRWCRGDWPSDRPPTSLPVPDLLSAVKDNLI